RAKSSPQPRARSAAPAEERTMNATTKDSVPPGLDMVDYLAKANAVDERQVQTALTLPKFRAALVTYEQSLVPLGYATFFSWPDVSAALPHLTPEQLRNMIRYSALRRKLDKSDVRHIAIDYGQVRGEFPHLFKSELNKTGPVERQQAHDELMAAMGEFLAAD